MAVANKKDTKSAILDAAETLMAEHGINGVSLRSILSEAGANSAALHYHFGSRDGLISAMLMRRGRPLNLRRRELLDALESSSKSPDVYDLVDVIVDPMMDILREEGEAGQRFLRFMARLQSDRAGIHLEEEDRHFHDVRERIAHLAVAACPHLSKSDLKRRVTMMIDTILQTLANAEAMSAAWDGEQTESALTEFAESLKDFLAGGLSAPVRHEQS